MFLLYAPPGAVLPLLSLFLEKKLGFTPVEIGWACAAQSLASLVAPLAAGQAADRWWPAEACLAVCAILAGVLLWLLAGLESFAAVFAVSLGYWLLMVPVLTLGTSLCFAHLALPESDYGRVRLWGTLGWVAAIWIMSGWFDDAGWLGGIRAWLRPDNPYSDLSDMFRLASLLSFLLAGYALTLPHTPPQRKQESWLAPAAALKLLRRRAFAVYTGTTLGLCVTIPFMGQLTPLLLQDLGIPLPWLSRALTLAQATEVAALALLPMMLLRFGTRGTMRLGLAAWTAALVMLMVGQPAALVVGSLTLNGLCICCFLVAGQVFVNRQASGDIRASVQGLLTFTNGLGLLIGNVLAGLVRHLASKQFLPTFGVAAAISLILTIAFFAGFPDEEAASENVEDAGLA
jgi:MFS family permease